MRFPMKIQGPMFDAKYAWHCSNFKCPNPVKRMFLFIGMYFGFIP